MSRNLKVIGLAIVAVFAMTALSASAASAAEFKGEGGGTTYSHGTTLTEHKFKITGRNVICKHTTSAVHQTANSATVLASLTYGECTIFGLQAAVNMNGCQYEFSASSPTAGGVKIVCPAGKEIAVEALNGKCKVFIGEQTPGVNTVNYAAEGSGSERSIKVTSAVSQIAATVVIGEGGSALLCGTAGLHTGASGGSYEGSITMNGYTSEAMTTRKGIFIE